MPRSQYGPAAGTNQGAATLPATIFVPDFLRLDKIQLSILLNQLRDPLQVHLMLLLMAGCEFTSGEIVTTYARLMELMRPPKMERARQRPGPSYEQLRTALRGLEAVRLVRRSSKNAEQGQLRLRVDLSHLRPVKQKPASVRK